MTKVLIGIIPFPMTLMIELDTASPLSHSILVPFKAEVML